jgi:DNA polymerase III alpha subunit (gram-positive type)
MKIFILDIETTATKSDAGHIIEIGGVLLNTDTGEIEEVFNSIIKETEKFDENAWIFDNSDLTPELIKTEGKPLEEIREPLQKLISKYPTTAYSRSFDIGWLKSRNFEFNIILEDPMLVATPILKIKKGSYSNYKWPKVQECLDYFKIHENEPHRAFEDAKLEARIVWELIKLKKFSVPEKKKPKIYYKRGKFHVPTN